MALEKFSEFRRSNLPEKNVLILSNSLSQNKKKLSSKRAKCCWSNSSLATKITNRNFTSCKLCLQNKISVLSHHKVNTRQAFKASTLITEPRCSCLFLFMPVLLSVHKNSLIIHSLHSAPSNSFSIKIFWKCVLIWLRYF